MRQIFFVSEAVRISADGKRTLVAVRHAKKHYHVHYVLQDRSFDRPRTKVLQIPKAEALLALEMAFDEVVPVVSIETKHEKRLREAASDTICLALEDAVLIARAESATQ